MHATAGSETGEFASHLERRSGRDCQTSLNSFFNACFEMFCRNPAKKWQRLPAAATRQDAASTIWGRTEKFNGHC